MVRFPLAIRCACPTLRNISPLWQSYLGETWGLSEKVWTGGRRVRYETSVCGRGRGRMLRPGGLRALQYCPPSCHGWSHRLCTSAPSTCTRRDAGHILLLYFGHPVTPDRRIEDKNFKRHIWTHPGLQGKFYGMPQRMNDCMHISGLFHGALCGSWP